MSHLEESLGVFIRRRREAIGLSVREMARRVQVSSTFLSKVETQGWKPGQEKLRKIAKLLKCDEDELLARGDKISIDLEELIKDMPRERAKLLRVSKDMTRAEVEALILKIEENKR